MEVEVEICRQREERAQEREAVESCRHKEDYKALESRKMVETSNRHKVETSCSHQKGAMSI
jgi:hypothetical protein